MAKYSDWRQRIDDRSSDYRRAKRAVSERYLGIPLRGKKIKSVKIPPEVVQNLVGVGAAEKRVDRHPQDAPAVTFYVREKLPKSRLTRSTTLPKSIDGLTCDVVASGLPSPCQTISPRGVVSPLSSGSQIKVAGIPAGTLGAFVRDADGDLCLITNAHVLSADLATGIGRSLYQPSPETPGSRRIGEVKTIVPVRADYSNFADVALAKLDPDFDIVTEIPEIGRLSGQGEGNRGQPVAKFGQITELRNGYLESIDTDFCLSYGFMTACYKEVYVVRGNGFLELGDSGSILMDPNSLRSLGMLFASGGILHYAIPATSLMRTLPGLTWL